MGTFTREGTWGAARHELPELAKLGITVVEIMPVADFPGRFGWNTTVWAGLRPWPFMASPTNSAASSMMRSERAWPGCWMLFRTPLGPDGGTTWRSFQKTTSPNQQRVGRGHQLRRRKRCPVRQHVAANAAYWIDEYHLDGLRLDATQQIFDASAEHILAAIDASVGARRGLKVIAENEPQIASLLRHWRAAVTVLTGCGTTTFTTAPASH